MFAVMMENLYQNYGLKDVFAVIQHSHKPVFAPEHFRVMMNNSNGSQFNIKADS